MASGSEQRLRESVVAAGRRLEAAGLVIGTAGNLSARDGDRVLITPTGARLAELQPDDLTVIDLDGGVIEGTLVPTSELLLHVAIYRSTSAGAVAHAHALASTALACTHPSLPPIHYLTQRLGGVVRVAPYATFGSAALADNVVAALEDRHAALMENHGSVACGADIAEACERLELLEWLADLYSRSIAIGSPRLLTEDELAAAGAAFEALRYGGVRPVADDPG